VPGRRQARRQAPPNPAGAHFLRDRELINALVRRSGASAGKLAFDLGAGYGAIAGALAAAGARVIAVERDPRLAGRLRHRFDGQAAISVVEADLRCVPLPRRDFLVVASPPFAVTTVLCRRLLGEPAVPLAGAELILAWGAARWLASPRPRDAESAWWACRYEISMTRRVRASSFLPPPSTDAAQVSVRRRPGAWSRRAIGHCAGCCAPPTTAVTSRSAGRCRDWSAAAGRYPVSRPGTSSPRPGSARERLAPW